MWWNLQKRAVPIMVAKCSSIGFPLISAGIFGYPKDQAWIKALQACQDFINDNPDCYIDIIFAVLDNNILTLGEQAAAELGINFPRFTMNDYKNRWTSSLGVWNKPE